MRDRVRFWLVMGTHTSLAAGTYLLGKLATQHFPVLALGLFRFLVAGLGFALLVRAKGVDLRAAWKADRSRFLWAGFLGVLLNQIGFLGGLQLTLPSHGALLYALTPTVVLLLAWLRGQEKPSPRKLGGIALAFAGVLVLFRGRTGDALPPHWILGDLLMLGAVFAWAGYTVLSRPLAIRHGALAATALSVWAGTLLFVPIGLFGVVNLHPAQAPAMAWVGALYLGLVSSVAMYLLWFHALTLREPSRVAIAANGQPVLTALLGWLCFGQAITPEFGVGTVLVVAGVLLTQL